MTQLGHVSFVVLKYFSLLRVFAYLLPFLEPNFTLSQ